MAGGKNVAVESEEGSRHRHTDATFQRVRLRLIEGLASCEGILMVFAEPEGPENTVFVVMDRDDFDEQIELQIYALQEELMREFEVPLSFACLPRVALQEGVPGPMAEVLMDKAV